VLCRDRLAMKHPVSADPGYGVARHKGCTFTQALYDEAKKDGWTVISMKNDWKRIFGFENAP
jgi:hypothetical protein